MISIFATLAAWACALGFHRKPEFVSPKCIGWECQKCHRVIWRKP